MGSKLDKRSATAWGLAAKQHGIVARRQLLDLGSSPRSIEHRITRGRLHPVSRGVYAVGWPYLDQQRRWMAAVVAAGDGAALSHGSAAALWEIGVERPGRMDVSVRRRCRSTRRGLRVHSRPSLPEGRIAQRYGIPLTDPVQTLVDLATELDRIRIERAINDADKRGLVDPDELRSALPAHAGEPGVQLLPRSWTDSTSASRTPISRSTSVLSPPRPGCRRRRANVG